MEYLFRPALVTDEPFLWEMLYHAAHMVKDGALSAQAARDNAFLAPFVEGWGQLGDIGVIALADAQPVGAAWVRVLSSEQHCYPNVPIMTPELAVAVLPRHAGHGIGTQLVTQVLAAACGTYASVVLTVRDDNPAQRLYARLGFAVTSQTTNRVGGISLIMLRDCG